MRFFAQRFWQSAVRLPLAERSPQGSCCTPLSLHTRAVPPSPSAAAAAAAATAVPPLSHKPAITAPYAGACLWRRPRAELALSSSSIRRAFTSSSSTSSSASASASSPSLTSPSSASSSSASSSPSSPSPSSPASSSSDSAPDPNASDAPADASNSPLRIRVPPVERIYQLVFTCRPCGKRSFHRMSGQGYHKGTVLVTCPQCRSRHVISDHLCIFTSTPETVESLLKERGEKVHKILAYQPPRSIEEVMAHADGPLKTAFESGNNDIEFLEDGSVRASRHTFLQPLERPEPT